MPYGNLRQRLNPHRRGMLLMENLLKNWRREIKPKMHEILFTLSRRRRPSSSTAYFIPRNGLRTRSVWIMKHVRQCHYIVFQQWQYRNLLGQWYFIDFRKRYCISTPILRLNFLCWHHNFWPLFSGSGSSTAFNKWYLIRIFVYRQGHYLRFSSSGGGIVW